jgi:hypothetical protein
MESGRIRLASKEDKKNRKITFPLVVLGNNPEASSLPFCLTMPTSSP